MNDHFHWKSDPSRLCLRTDEHDRLSSRPTAATEAEAIRKAFALFSAYQRRAIFQAMLAQARQLAQAGVPAWEVREQVGQLRNQLAQAALVDLVIRRRRGHLR